jgi:hypothetical protein
VRRTRGALLAFVAAGVVFAVSALVAAWYFSSQRPGVLTPPSGPMQPDPNPLSGYQIEVALDGSSFSPVRIGADGAGCEIFSDDDANRTCLIAINTIPSIIGGEAFGELNFKHTPAFDALVWRSIVENDITVCARGGLEDDFLRRCEMEAANEDYEYEVGPVRVHVVTGSADPVPTAMT